MAVVALIAALAVGDLIFTVAESVGRHSAPLTAVQAVPRPAAVAAASPAPAASSTRGPVSGAMAVRLLTIASAAADGPDGTSDGDHPGLAAGIINGGDGQAWQTSWYATPEFGQLKPGTGLLLDMGAAVNVSRVRLALGTPVGVDVQVRVGNLSLPAQLPVAASASDVGGTVQLRLNTAANGRYVLIWFTRLPAEFAGQISGDRLQRRRIWRQEDIIRRARPKSSIKLDAIRSYSITIQT